MSKDCPLSDCYIEEPHIHSTDGGNYPAYPAPPRDEGQEEDESRAMEREAEAHCTGLRASGIKFDRIHADHSFFAGWNRSREFHAQQPPAPPERFAEQLAEKQKLVPPEIAQVVSEHFKEMHEPIGSPAPDSDVAGLIAEARSRLEAAHKMVSDLCHRRREWVMSIPARPDYDPDLVIGLALRKGDRLADALEAAHRRAVEAEAHAKNLEGRVGNLNQQLAHPQFENSKYYKQVARSRKGDRRAVVRGLVKAEQRITALESQLAAQSPAPESLSAEQVCEVLNRVQHRGRKDWRLGGMEAQIIWSPFFTSGKPKRALQIEFDDARIIASYLSRAAAPPIEHGK